MRSWDQTRDHYPADVRAALDALVPHAPDLTSARRLVLWHGAPGTGKTSAVRALLHAWRHWPDAVVVTDPDSLLTDGRYLRRVLLDVDEDDERWRLLVLEDAEALLRKETGGSAMGKLLNLADGLLGQGLRWCSSSRRTSRSARSTPLSCGPVGASHRSSSGRCPRRRPQHCSAAPSTAR